MQTQTALVLAWLIWPFVVLALFTLTIVPMEETGFLMKLEPWSDEAPESYRLKRRNVLSIYYYNVLLVRGDSASIKTLKSKVIEFVSNPDKSLEMAENPWQAKIFFHYEDFTKYQDFIAIMEAIKSAYRELWEAEAMKRFKKPYSKISRSEKQVVRNWIPFSLEVEMAWHCGW